MRRQILGQTDLEVSQLGFGCVKLTSQPDRRDALRILEEAFAHGITHFDVARAYGFGRAEGILGDFLQGKRQMVTIATKVGIQPPTGLAGNRWIIDLSKKILGPFPTLLRRAKQRGSRLVKSGAFTPAIMIQSLETSLRELRTDYVDLLLLHEATLEDTSSKPLVEALQQQVVRGTVRALGVASAFHKLGNVFPQVPALYQVLQFDDNVHRRNVRVARREGGRGIITHSIFKPASSLQSAIVTNGDLANWFSSQINEDLRKPSVIGSFLLHYALQSNPDGVVLFSTSDQRRISENVQAAGSRRYNGEQICRFVDFVDAALTQASFHAEPNDPSSPPTS